MKIRGKLKKYREGQFFPLFLACYLFLLSSVVALAEQKDVAKCASEYAELVSKQSVLLTESDRKVLEYLKEGLGRERAAGNLTKDFCTYLNAIGNLSFCNGEISPLIKEAIELSALSQDEGMAIYAYTQHIFRRINFALRTKDPELLDGYKRAIDAIVSGLAKINDHRGWVYRGTTLPPEVLADHRVGNILKYDGFTSASIGGIQNLFKNEKHHFKILSTRGKDISLFNTWGEKEILFLPGTEFKVLSKESKGEFIEIELMECPCS